MKIVLIGPAYPYRGGIADTNESFARALMNKGHEVTIITFKLQYPDFLFPGKTQYSTDPKPADLKIFRYINSMNPLNWIATARKINQLSPELVIVRFWLPFLGPCLGTIARRLNKKTKLLALCDNVIPHEKRFGDKGFTKYFINSFDGFITMSKTVSAELKLFTQKPQIYFPHPINDNLGAKLPKLEAKKHLNLHADGKYLLFFGLIRKYKGLDLMLQAMADKRIKALGIQLLIVGEFYDDPKEYYDMIEVLNIKNQVIIKNEYVPAADIKYYFSAVDLITQTYHSASQSGVTQMAFNFECPILVTNVGGLSEIVAHEKFGYVTPKVPAVIADCIVDYYKNNRAEKFIENVKIEKEKYSWGHFSDGVIELYEQLNA
jgi:D-inositol-3-phosphate glycosyltransferase